MTTEKLQAKCWMMLSGEADKGIASRCHREFTRLTFSFWIHIHDWKTKQESR